MWSVDELSIPPASKKTLFGTKICYQSDAQLKYKDKEKDTDKEKDKDKDTDKDKDKEKDTDKDKDREKDNKRQ